MPKGLRLDQLLQEWPLVLKGLRLKPAITGVVVGA